MKILFRLFYLYFIVIRYNLDSLLWTLPNHYIAIRFLKILFPIRWFQKNTPPTPKQITEALIHLGPIFIKLGQILSTRRDILPADLALELAKLQDQIPGFSSDIAIELIENTFHKPLNILFKHFEPIPLAAASIAQVHAAELSSGEKVVIKLRRPGIHALIKKDLRLMLLLAKILNKIPEFKRYKPIEIIQEFEKTLDLELNLLNEAANGSLLKRNFSDSEALYIPTIYWEYARPHLIVMERIEGIPISDIPALKTAGINLKLLAQRGVEIFFTQVFRDSFFHADMHPGNIFVNPNHPHNPQYIAVDFGIMGALTSDDQHYLAHNFLAFFKRDYKKVAELYIKAGWVNTEVRITELEGAIRTVCEPLFERPLQSISFSAALLALFQTARRFDMQVQPQFLLLQKTLVNIEGLGKQLYPELNLWHTAQPILEKWIQTQINPVARFSLLLTKLKNQVPQWIDKMLDSIQS